MLSILKKTIKTLVLAAALLTISVMGPNLHESYLVNIEGLSVVKLGVPGVGFGTGSQIEYKDKKYILTNRHVCEIGNKYIYAFSSLGIKAIKILKKSDDDDLCIAEGIDYLPALKLAYTSFSQQRIFTVGHPLGYGKTLVSGRVLEQTRIELQVDCDKKVKGAYKKQFQSFFGMVDVCMIDRRALRISNVTFPGNSGSPVLNVFGNIVGVIFAGRRSVENMGYMVPLSAVKEFLESI